MLNLIDPTDTRCGAFVDIGQETWPPRPTSPIKNSTAARTHRKNTQEGIEAASNRPGVRVRPEVATPRPLGAAGDECAGKLLTQRYHQIGE